MSSTSNGSYPYAEDRVVPPVTQKISAAKKSMDSPTSFTFPVVLVLHNRPKHLALFLGKDVMLELPLTHHRFLWFKTAPAFPQPVNFGLEIVLSRGRFEQIRDLLISSWPSPTEFRLVPVPGIK